MLQFCDKVIEKMLLNEADRRAELIDPKLKGADWTDEIIQREQVYYSTEPKKAAGLSV